MPPCKMIVFNLIYPMLQQFKLQTIQSHHLTSSTLNSQQFSLIQQMHQISTTYIHKKLTYFFTRNEVLDLQIGSQLKVSINYCLNILEQSMSINSTTSQDNEQHDRDRDKKLLQNKYKFLEANLALLAHIITLQLAEAEQQQFIYEQEKSDEQNKDEGIAKYKNVEFVVNEKKFIQFYENDGLRCCIFALKNYIEYLINTTNPAKISIIDEMIIKTLINLIYTTLFSYKSILTALSAAHPSTLSSNNILKEQLNKLRQTLIQLQVDDLLIKMVTLTLQVYWLPIKKLVMLYTRVLIILFNTQQQQQSSTEQLYKDDEILNNCIQNQLSENYLKEFKEKNKSQDIKFKQKINPIEHFYAKHNVGDCPLAQSIVVGLLRSLLTICNSQMHKKFNASPSKGMGADSYREWQISYQFVAQSGNLGKDYREYLSNKSQNLLKNYIQYNESAIQNPSNNDKSLSNSANIPILPTHYEFYRHKIYATSAISIFFTFLLKSFRSNAMIQFTYLYQLISDANGILVFLKFLTDKFECLEPLPQEFDTDEMKKFLGNRKEELTNKRENTQICSLKFKEEVMLTVYSVLLILYGACNNYAQKTRSFLFEYNSYLIIKKIPHIFMKVHKNDDQLPSQQQIQAQFGRNNTVSSKKIEQFTVHSNAITSKVKQLTFLCYSLLKIQIPFFSKKMKENTNNMKMIVQIYCQMPKKIEPIKRTQLDKLLLKNQMRKIQHEKFILSVQQLKGVHNEYNNLYYWSNEEAKINEANQKNEQIVQAPLKMTREEMETWLEENVWKFYD